MRNKSLRRKIYETACLVVLGRIPEKGEHTAVEERMNSQWYGSGQKDFSFYSHEDYRFLLLNSWAVASQFDVEKCVKLNLIRDPAGRFFDFHGGVGMTAAYLAASYPDARVYTHSVVPWHLDAAAEIAGRLDLSNMGTTAEVPNIHVDLLIAQETLEHFEDPFTVIRGLLDQFDPDQYLDGSSFTFDSPGHFNPFKDGDRVVTRREAKRTLNKILTERGYVRPWDDPKTGIGHLYNNRPAIWGRPL